MSVAPFIFAYLLLHVALFCILCIAASYVHSQCGFLLMTIHWTVWRSTVKCPHRIPTYPTTRNNVAPALWFHLMVVSISIPPLLLPPSPPLLATIMHMMVFVSILMEVWVSVATWAKSAAIFASLLFNCSWRLTMRLTMVLLDASILYTRPPVLPHFESRVTRDSYDAFMYLSAQVGCLLGNRDHLTIIVVLSYWPSW